MTMFASLFAPPLAGRLRTEDTWVSANKKHVSFTMLTTEYVQTNDR
jgi:hypothetical protein